MQIKGTNAEDITWGLIYRIVTIVITKPSTGNMGNFLILNGDIKGLCNLAVSI